ncbi:MAG: hypothetical protein JWN97_65 [Nocardioides sp.]|nr:hypothetical protein [Nocardioides sp.]
MYVRSLGQVLGMLGAGVARVAVTVMTAVGVTRRSGS